MHKTFVLMVIGAMALVGFSANAQAVPKATPGCTYLGHVDTVATYGEATSTDDFAAHQSYRCERKPGRNGKPRLVIYKAVPDSATSRHQFIAEFSGYDRGYIDCGDRLLFLGQWFSLRDHESRWEMFHWTDWSKHYAKRNGCVVR